MVSAAVDPAEVRRETHAKRRARFGRFQRVLGGITLVMHVPVALGVAELARRLAWPHPWLIGVAWALAIAGAFIPRERSAMPDAGRAAWIVRLLDVPYFVFWCAGVYTLIPSVVLTLLSPIVDLLRGAPVSLPLTGYMAIYLSGLVVSAYGVLVRRRWFRVVERDVRVAGLPSAFEGLRVAHLSDLHIGAFTPREWGLRWSRAANDAKPDLAVTTGDLVTNGDAHHDAIADVVGELRAPMGTFASMGNHDYFGHEEELVSLLRGRGVKVLRNEGALLERGGAQVWLAAIDDTWTRRDDLALALKDKPEGLPTLLLAHDPNRFDQAADAGVELVLSGHTHGGQVAVPFVAKALNLARIAYKYSLGIYEKGRSTLYVHPGLGTTGPPIRLGAAPEVTILVLRTR
jgi:predicted MPP superfamily phosphohydrolase